MKEEKSSVDILKDIAKREGWGIDCDEQVLNKRYGLSKRKIVIRNYQKPEFYFISSQIAGFDKYKTYSGIFVPVGGYENYELFIKRKYGIEKLFLLGKKNVIKLGNDVFDKNVLVKTNNSILTHRLLGSSKLQFKIIDFLNRTDNVYIGFNELNPVLDGKNSKKNFLSVFIALNWMLDKDMIKECFHLAEMLNENFI